MMTDGSDISDGDSAGGETPHGGQPHESTTDWITPKTPGEPVEEQSPQRGQAPPTAFRTSGGQVPPVRPPDPIGPFIRRPGMRRRPREWPVLVFALIMASLVMVGCCVAGLAVYSTYGARIR